MVLLMISKDSRVVVCDRCKEPAMHVFIRPTAAVMLGVACADHVPADAEAVQDIELPPEAKSSPSHEPEAP